MFDCFDVIGNNSAASTPRRTIPELVSQIHRQSFVGHWKNEKRSESLSHHFPRTLLARHATHFHFLQQYAVFRQYSQQTPVLQNTSSFLDGQQNHQPQLHAGKLLLLGFERGKLQHYHSQTENEAIGQFPPVPKRRRPRKVNLGLNIKYRPIEN